MKIPFKAAFDSYRSERRTRNERRALSLLAVTSPHNIKDAPRSERRGVERALNCLLKSGRPHLVRNWYISGDPYSDGSRSYLPEVLTDARYDQNQISRREAMRRMRYWEQNSVFVKRGLDVSSRYVIGTHTPVVTSLASDVDWQSRAEAVFAEMCCDAGLNGESLLALLSVGHRRKKIDGNILFVQTSKPGFITIRAGTKHETQLPLMKPCYQAVESHRIGTPFSIWQEENQSIFDGVKYKEITTKLPSGQTVKHKVKEAYYVNDSANIYSVDEGFTEVPCENAYYAATAHRVNEDRSMTDFYAAEPTLALLEDLLKLEMKAQEVQSDIALFITNGAGQVVDSTMQRNIASLGIKMSTSPTTGLPVVTSEDISKVKAVYDKIWGGKTMVGRTGDSMTPIAPVRPAEATLNLWNFLIDSFCAASGFPRLLVFPKFNKGQGTEVRAELQAASADFIAEFNLVWKPFMHQVWEYFIGWAVKNDERVKNPPADWRNIEVSSPRSLTVDTGYDSAARLAELAAGVTNLHQWAKDMGTTKSKLILQSVSDVYDIKLACAKMAERPEYKKFGLSVEAAEVRNNLAEVAKNLAAVVAADAQKTMAETAEQPA